MSVFLAGLVVVRSGVPVVFALAVATVVAKVPSAVSGGFGSAAGHALVLALAVVGLALVVQQLVPWIEWTVGDTVARRFTAVIERRLVRAMLGPAGLTHLDDAALTDEVAAATRGLSGWPRPGEAARALSARLAAHLSLMAASVLLVVFHWWLALLVLVSAVWLQAQLVGSLLSLSERQAGQAAAQRESLYFRQLVMTPGAAKELRIFGLGGWIAGRYARSWARAFDVVAASRVKERRSLIAAAATVGLIMVVAFVLLGWQAGEGTVSLAQVAIVLQAMAVVAGSLSDEGTVTDGLALAFAMRSLRIADAVESRLAAVPQSLTGTASAAGLPGTEIRFEGIFFRYPGHRRAVLSGLDLVVPAGRSLAIVGANGAGKTTLIKLLCRLYEPTAGRITVDATDLRDINPEQWQRRIAAIFQDYVRYPFSASDNVTFGATSHADDEQLRQVASAKSGADRIVAGLPSGWDTPLSREFPGGTDLSGGQWQRIALARALFAAAAGASLLILDEPTASLDVRGEAEIYDRFLEVTANMTTIIISHRFSTVRRADRIAVLEAGRIAEYGTHEELMAAQGRYAELFALQASRFGEELAR